MIAAILLLSFVVMICSFKFVLYVFLVCGERQSKTQREETQHEIEECNRLLAKSKEENEVRSTSEFLLHLWVEVRKLWCGVIPKSEIKFPRTLAYKCLLLRKIECWKEDFLSNVGDFTCFISFPNDGFESFVMATSSRSIEIFEFYWTFRILNVVLIV